MNDNLSYNLLIDTMAEVANLRTRVEALEKSLLKTIEGIELIVRTLAAKERGELN